MQAFNFYLQGFPNISANVGVWFVAGAMFVFLTLLILYPNERLTGFATATKTCRAAKLYQRPLSSMISLSVLKWTSESEYFERSLTFLQTYNI